MVTLYQNSFTTIFARKINEHTKWIFIKIEITVGKHKDLKTKRNVGLLLFNNGLENKIGILRNIKVYKILIFCKTNILKRVNRIFRVN